MPDLKVIKGFLKDAESRLLQGDDAGATVSLLNRVIDEFSTALEVEVVECVHLALLMRAAAFSQQRRFAEAVADTDRVVEPLSNSVAGADVRTDELLARGLGIRAAASSGMGRFDEAMRDYDDVLTRFGRAPVGNFLVDDCVAKALSEKGGALLDLERPAEAIAVYDEVLDRFEAVTDAGIRDTVARSLLNKGIALGQLGRHEDAIDSFSALVARFGDAPEQAMRWRVAWSLYNKGEEFRDLDQPDQAERCFDEVLERYDTSQDPQLLSVVAATLVGRARLATLAGDNERAISIYDEMIRRFSSATEQLAQESLAWARVDRGLALQKLGLNEAALQAYDSAIVASSDLSEPAADDDRPILNAFLHKAALLESMGRTQEAISAYSDLDSRYGADPNPGWRQYLDSARARRADLLKKLGMGDSAGVTPEAESANAVVDEGVRLAWEEGKPDEALGLWDEVIAAHAASTDPVVQWCVKTALYKKGLLLVELRRRNEAIAVYRQIAALYAPERGRYAQGALARLLMAGVRAAVLLRLQRVGDWLLIRAWPALPEDHPRRRLSQ